MSDTTGTVKTSIVRLSNGHSDGVGASRGVRARRNDRSQTRGRRPGEFAATNVAYRILLAGGPGGPRQPL